MRRQYGFTLAEILIAMFVIVVGLSGVTATIWWALQKQDAGRLMTEASNHARVLFEELQVQGPLLLNGSAWPDADSGLVDDPDVRRALYDPPFSQPTAPGIHLHGQSEVTGTSGNQVGEMDNTASETARFTRNIRCTRMVPTNPPDDDYLADMALVEVKIYWSEKTHERHATVEGLVTHGVE